MPDDDYSDVIAAAAPPVAPKPRKMVRGIEKLKGVQPDLINHWNNLQTEFDKAGVVPEIKSGFRTAEQQNSLHRRGYPTKGNDGYINISPHQEGRGLDLGFNGAQKAKGREIIANYAKQNGLTVPSDEPWHIAIPKQKVGQSDDDYADVVAAATGQKPDDNYDDVVSAAQPAQVGASVTARTPQRARAKPNALQVGAGLSANVPTRQARATQDAINQGMGVTAQAGKQVARPLDIGLRTQDTPAVTDINKILTEATHSPEAEARGQIKKQVVDEREKQRQSALGKYGGMIGTPQIGAGAFDVLNKAMSPVSTLTNLTKSEEELTNEEVEKRRESQKRFNTPEMIEQRKEFGKMSSPRRAVSAPAARFGAGMLKGIGGLTSALGVAPNQLSDYFNNSGQVLEEATNAPLDDAGKEVVRGIPEKVVSAVGDLGFGIAQIVALKKAFPSMSMAQIMGAETAFKTSNMSAAERADAIAHATVMGKVLDGHLGRVKSAAVFGVPTAIESGSAVAKGQMSPEDAILNTAVQTASGFALGGKSKEQLVKDGVPEKPEAMQAQLEQRGYTLVPEGTARPSLPRGTRAEKTADGIVYYNPAKVSRETIRSTPTAELLGHVEEKSPTTTEAVVARAPDGSEIQSSAVSPENVAKQAEVMQQQYPQAKVETGGSELAEQVINERITPQRYQHLQFREVEVLPDQTGAGNGRVKVSEVGDASKVHYVKKADLQGRGNSRMIPIKGAEPSATQPAEPLPEAALPATAPTSETNKAAQMAEQRSTAAPPQPEGFISRDMAERLTQLGITPEQQASMSTVEKAKLISAENRRGPRRTDEAEWEALSPEEKSMVKSAPERRGADRPEEADWMTLSPEEKARQRESLDFEESQRTPESRAADAAELDRKFGLPAESPSVREGELKTAILSDLKESPVRWDIEKDAQGVAGNTKSVTDLSYEKNPAEIYDSFNKTREALRAQHGDSVQMWRAEPPTNERVADKPLTRWTTDKKLAENFAQGRTVESRQVPVGDVVAAYTHPTESYTEFLVRPSPQVGVAKGREVIQPSNPTVKGETIEPTAPVSDANRPISSTEGAGGQSKEIPASPIKAATPELQHHADAAVAMRQRLTDPNLTGIERAMMERKAARFESKARGEKEFRAGTDPYELIEDIVIRGGELLRAGKASFNEWSRKIREEFGPKANEHLQKVWSQLHGESTTAAKKASMQADRAEFGLEALPRPATKKDVDLLESAKDAHAADPTEAARIADKVLNGKHTLDDKETLQLDLRAQEVKNTHDKILSEINDAKDDATIASKAADADALEAEFNKLSEATDKSGTEQARAFRARRLTINQDMELLPMLARAKKARGRDLNPEERAKIAEQQKQIEQLTKERDTALENNKAERIQKEIDKAKRATKRGETREKLDKDAAVIKQNILAEIARLRAGQSSTHSMAGLGSLDPEGVISRELVKYFRNRAQAHIKLNAEALVDEVHSLVTDLGVDKRAVRDLLSGYSMEVKNKRTEIQKHLDDLRTELQAISKAEDIEVGKRSPHREGPTKGEARQSGQPLEGPRLSESTERKAGPRLTDAPTQGPKLSDARRSGIPMEGPRITDAPKLGPRDTWPARKKAIEKQITEYERRIAEGDFSKRATPEPIIHTRESKRLDDKLQRVKSAYNLANERAESWHWLKTAGSIRKSGMLSGYLTHVRNILGTGAYIGFEEARRVPSAFADALMSPIKNRRTVTLSPSATLDGVIHSLTEGRRGAKEIIKHGATAEQMERQQLREINTGAKAVDVAFNAVFRFMSASDHIFYSGSYKRNLVERAQAQAKTEARTDKSIDWRKRAKELEGDKGIQTDAKHDALVSTFNNNNRLSDAIKSARARLGAGGNFALDLVLPFDRTPTNVIARVIEASPAGYVKNAGQITKALWSKEFTAAQQRAIAETFGRATTGSAIMLLGGALAAKGLLTTDDYGTTYLEFGGHKINLSAVAPLGTMLSVGAGLYKQWKNPDATKRNYAAAVAKPLADQPLLKGTSQVSEIVKDPNRNLPQVAANLATSFVPFSGAIRTAAQGLDPADKRYPDKTFKEQLMKDIPKVRESLPASHVRLMGSEVNKATKEVERLGIKIKGAVKQEDETPEEFKTREAVQNGNIRTQIENVVALPEFDKASDADKTAWLKQAAEFASARTKESLPEKKEKPEQKQFPMPQSGFERAYPADSLNLYEKMSPSQRTANRASMARKAKVLLSDPRLSAEKKAEFKSRLDTLGIAPTSTRPRTMREQLGASP